MKISAPFPYFGGKSLIADEVWRRFGNPKYYIEPFFGSGAALLARPSPPREEIVNDIDGFIANFWRAMSKDAAAVAQWADYPINEIDLYARHGWLIGVKSELVTRMESDPEYYDAKIAGWWVWGLSQWIGKEWCGEKRHRRIPLLTHHCGVHQKTLSTGLLDYFTLLQQRLRRVSVCCGDWKRVIAWQGSPEEVCAIFLDPPYADTKRGDVYSHEAYTLGNDVEKWALEYGDDLRRRIALCGYEGNYNMPESWTCVAWKAPGGYGNRGKENPNRFRERVWFSPNCLNPAPTLF